MNKAVRGAVGTLKHEGMHLTPEEMKLLEAYVSGQITEKEYDNRALELALGEPLKTKERRNIG